jgi:site-specific DNA recombinase
MAELEAERARLAAALEATAPAPPVALHPNLPALYRRQVERLEAALNDPMIRDEAAEVLRELIEKVVLLPARVGQGAGRGALWRSPPHPAALRGGGREARHPQTQTPRPGEPGSQTSVVAGARNCLYLLLFAGALAARSR